MASGGALASSPSSASSSTASSSRAIAPPASQPRGAGGQQQQQPPPHPAFVAAVTTGEPPLRQWERRLLEPLPTAKARQALVRACDASGLCALHHAAMRGDTEVLDWLLAHGALVEQPTLRDGRTALHCAVQSRRPRVLERLVEAHGANVRSRDASGRTALFFARRLKATDVEAWLLHRGVRLEHTSTVVLEAVMDGQTTRAGMDRLLREHEIDLDQRDASGMAALHHAAARDEVGALEWLAEHGVDVHGAGRGARTALHYAAQGGSLRAMQWLEARGLDLDGRAAAAAADAPTPLELATFAGHEHVVRWLVMRGH